jgi:uncharacterized protein (TIGR01370 family)
LRFVGKVVFAIKLSLCASAGGALAGVCAEGDAAAFSRESITEAQVRPELHMEGFGIQYWGDAYTAEGLAAAPHCALIIEASVLGADHGPEFREIRFTRDEVRRIGNCGERPVLAYLNVAELAPYRDFWVEAFGRDDDPADVDPDDLPPWYGLRNARGELLAAYWRPEWEAILRRQIDGFLESGFGGVFLDDVLAYYFWPDTLDPRLSGMSDTPVDRAGFARSMMALVSRLGRYARLEAGNARPDFTIVVNGGAYIGWDAASTDGPAVARHAEFDAYVSAIDGIAMESMFGTEVDVATVAALRENYVSAGLPVLTIDYNSRHPEIPSEDFRAMVGAQATEQGFVPYVSGDETFSRLDPPILVGRAANDRPRARCPKVGSPSDAAGVKTE